jgi:hypothetical protein
MIDHACFFSGFSTTLESAARRQATDSALISWQVRME